MPKDILEGVKFTTYLPPYVVDVRAIRNKLGMTTEEFAYRFGFDLDDLGDWEERTRMPSLAERMLMTMLDAEPEVVLRVLDKPPVATKVA